MKKSCLFFSIFLLLFTSCIKKPDDIITSESKSIEDISVPNDFNWETGKVVTFNISVESDAKYEAYYRIGLFLGNPAIDGQLLVAGSATEVESFSVQLGLPNRVDTIFLSCENPMGVTQYGETAITSNEINYTFTEKGSKSGINYNKVLPGFKSGPDCNSGCDEEISGSGNVDINNGKVYCITESFTGNINFQAWNGGGTLRVCGEAEITNNTLSLQSNCHIEIAEGATFQAGKIDMGNDATFSVYDQANVSLSKFNVWSGTTSILNYGTISISTNSYHKGAIENHGNLLYQGDLEIDGTDFTNFNQVSTGGSFETYGSGCSVGNHGTFITNNNFETNSNTTFTNNGEIEIGNKLTVNETSIWINNGSILVESASQFNTNTQFTNNCKFSCNNKVEVNGNAKIVLYQAYFKASDELYFWTSTDLELHNNSMLKGAELEMTTDLLGVGDLNSVIIEGDVSIWGNYFFNGALELATPSGDLNYGTTANFVNGAYFTSIDEALNFLPISSCNPEGFGTPTIIDSDLDGVPDNSDDYPNDPDRAFNNYFPSAGSHITLAFEDLWPSTGDYDFNDLVFIVYGNEVTNAQNNLVEIFINCAVEAVGASLNNGIGLQLDNISPDQIASVTGTVLNQGYVTTNANGTEANQTKAVIIITESVDDIITRAAGSMFNTIPENPQGDSDTLQLHIMFNTPIDYNLVSNNGYNPFLIIDQDRDVEIHLSGYAPTDLMDISLFGTSQDASDPGSGTYFVTEQNLPWGLMFLEPFEYPAEKAPIINAYNYFSSWAESGGNLYSDWYLNQPGYRNESEIYGD